MAEDDPIGSMKVSRPALALRPRRQHVSEAAAGMSEPWAWKEQQIAEGWRNLVNALRRHKQAEGSSVS
jgi:hypothetical protein